MTWEEKLAACQQITNCSLHMRKPGNWYVNWHAELKCGALLEGRYGSGASPEAAVNDHWRIVTDLKPGEYWVVGAHRGDTRSAYRWTGSKWTPVDEDLNP